MDALTLSYGGHSTAIKPRVEQGRLKGFILDGPPELGPYFLPLIDVPKSPRPDPYHLYPLEFAVALTLRRFGLRPGSPEMRDFAQELLERRGALKMVLHELTDEVLEKVGTWREALRALEQPLDEYHALEVVLQVTQRLETYRTPPTKTLRDDVKKPYGSVTLPSFPRSPGSGGLPSRTPGIPGPPANL